MNKKIAILFAGLVVGAIGVGVLLLSTKGGHLELTGQVLKVRILSLNPNASLVIVDFRVTNPSDVRFVVRSAATFLTPLTGEPVEGAFISKADVENVFKYEKLLGPKYNDVLTIKDPIAPHQTMDRMVGARFELPESAIEARKNIRVHIEDLDGTEADIVEKK